MTHGLNRPAMSCSCGRRACARCVEKSGRPFGLISRRIPSSDANPQIGGYDTPSKGDCKHNGRKSVTGTARATLLAGAARRVCDARE